LARNDTEVPLRGGEEMRCQQLQDVLAELNKALRRRERRKRKLLKEAMRLQREADLQVGLILEIHRMEDAMRAPPKELPRERPPLKIR